MSSDVPRDINPAIFRRYDIRGIVGRDLTPAIARDIGQALGSLYPGVREVVLGWDGRHSSPTLSEALGDGLRTAGVNILDLGQVPTPLLYYTTRALATGAGVMITGSHNPPEYNGIKIVMEGHALHDEGIARIHQRILRGDLLRAPERGHIRPVDLADRYIREIADSVHLDRTLRIAVDYGNGVAGPVGGRLLRALGCEVTDLFAEVDGRFPNHHPNPSDPGNLSDLIASVTRNGLDLGLAFDGDGDRLGLVDDKGSIIWPDRQMMLFSRDVLAHHPGALVLFDVKSSHHLAPWIASLGGRPLMWKTGHSLLKAKMRDTGALLAGELSGHICFADRWYGFDDALYSAARLLEILARNPEPCSTLFDGLPHGVATPEMYLNFATEAEQERFMRAVLERADLYGGKQTRIDGLRVDYPDGWALVRASNTTPSVVIRMEADSETALKAFKNQWRKKLQAIAPQLVLPF